MKLPHPIPYQGSKRNLADRILRFYPDNFNRFVEPFAGSAAMTISSAYYRKAKHFVLNDINKPLSQLWDVIINNPKHIIDSYHHLWHQQIGNEDIHYLEIRNRFNKTQEPEYLLFLLANCVKAAVRYNSSGEFNQSRDKRRMGRNPQMMKDDINRVSNLLKGKTEIYFSDYKEILSRTSPTDLIYMDPPYQGTGMNGGFNYAGNIEFSAFVDELFELNKKNIPYILSFDGRTGDKTHGKPLPNTLNLFKIEVDAGRSTQATLLNRNENTFESIYVSPALVKKIDLQKAKKPQLYQTNLFANHG